MSTEGDGPRPDYDVAIVGGGLAGAALAALLVHRSGLAPERIALLAPEPPEPRAADAAPDLRVAAISRASQRILEHAQAWQRLPSARLCPYQGMRIWHETAPPRGDNTLVFDAADLGEPDLGHIIENCELVRACMASFTAAGGALVSHAVTALRWQEHGVEIQTAASAFAARLVVGADGARSLVRAQAGLAAGERSYHQRALVATVATAAPHEHTAWQRFLASGPLALLPLHDGHSSIVWSVDEALAEELLQCPPEDFNRRLTQACDEVLGACRLDSERLSFPLRSAKAGAYVAPRCALIGDAAHVVHPLAGQGANLGLLDAAALCECLAQGLVEREDPGAMRLLRRYEQQRRSHNLAVDAAMSGFKRFFGARVGPGAWLVNRALGTVNRSGVLKQHLARHAMGMAGELPRFARAPP